VKRDGHLNASHVVLPRRCVSTVCIYTLTPVKHFDPTTLGRVA
jgi:hypothetical protein